MTKPVLWVVERKILSKYIPIAYSAWHFREGAMEDMDERKAIQPNRKYRVAKYTREGK